MQDFGQILDLAFRPDGSFDLENTPPDQLELRLARLRHADEEATRELANTISLTAILEDFTYPPTPKSPPPKKAGTL